MGSPIFTAAELAAKFNYPESDIKAALQHLGHEPADIFANGTLYYEVDALRELQRLTTPPADILGVPDDAGLIAGTTKATETFSEQHLADLSGLTLEAVRTALADAEIKAVEVHGEMRFTTAALKALRSLPAKLEAIVGKS